MSPLRGFTPWLRDNACVGDVNELRNDDARLKLLAIQYLSENTNPVQKFHLGNGAYIGDVNLHANCQSSADYMEGMNVMMNYVYPKRDIRTQLQDAYKQGGEMHMAPHLADIAEGVVQTNPFKRFIP